MSIRPRWQPTLPRLGRGTETCERKVRYATWDEARLAGVAVWRDNPRETDANMPTAYPCDAIGEKHFHCGHIRFGGSHG